MIQRILKYLESKYMLIFFLLSGIALFSSTRKTPNFGLMGGYYAPNFPDITTGMHILRLWTYVEKFEYFNINSLFYSNNFLYGLLAGYLGFLIYKRAEKNNKLKILIPLFPGLIVGVFFAAYAGPVFDIVFALAFFICMCYAIDIGKNITKKQVYYLGFWVTLMYMSRPYGIYFSILLYFYFGFLIRKKIIPAILITFAFMAPFHVIQLVKFDTFMLSTYGGTNLVEALGSVGQDQNNFLDCKVILGRNKFDSKEMVDCSKINQARAIEVYIDNPYIFLKLFSPKRIFGTFMFPNLYWHGTEFTDDYKRSLELKTIKIIFYLSLFSAYILILLSYKNTKEFNVPMIGFALGVIFPCMGTDGSEALRIFMPFIVLAYLVITNRDY
jgi:hypothetical protein